MSQSSLRFCSFLLIFFFYSFVWEISTDLFQVNWLPCHFYSAGKFIQWFFNFSVFTVVEFSFVFLCSFYLFHWVFKKLHSLWEYFIFNLLSIVTISTLIFSYAHSITWVYCLFSWNGRSHVLNSLNVRQFLKVVSYITWMVKMWRFWTLSCSSAEC